VSETNYDAQLKSMNLKINRLEGEVDALRKEIEVLKRNGGTVKAAEVNKPAVHRPVYVPEAERVPALAKANVVKSSEGNAVVSPNATETTTPVSAAVSESKPVKEKTSMENKIGKNLMGIIASILVFAALIVFGGMIYEVIPDIAKVIIMYGISFAFAIVGINKMSKEGKFKVFFSSLAGCGVSAVYLSSLLAYFAFGILPAPVLVGIIVVWLVVTGLLSKKKSKIFMYICNVGLVISVMLITFDWGFYYLAAILYILGLAFIYFLNRSKSYNKDCHVFMQLAIVLMILTASNEYDCVFATIFYVVVTAILVLREFFYEINRKNLTTYIVTSSIWLLYTCGYSAMIEKQTIIGEYASFIFVVMFTAYASLFCLKHRELSKSLTYVIYYIWAFSLITINVGFIDEYLSFSLLALAFLVAGIIRKRIHLSIPGYFYLFLFLCAPPNALEDKYADLIVMAAIVVLFIYNTKNYNVVFKFINTGLFIAAFLTFCYKASFGAVPTFIVMAALSLFINTKFYAKNYDTDELEKGTVIFGYVFNALMMLTSLYFIHETSEPFMIMQKAFFTDGVNIAIVCLVAIALFTVNTKRLFSSSVLPKELSAVYIGVKYTVLIVFILNKMSAISFVISLVLLAFSIVCIILGFKFKFKGIRLYGLILTLVTVAKIILSDIEYDSYIYKPLGLLAAGLLCFGISWIYSRLEKQTKIEETEEAKNNDNVDI